MFSRHLRAAALGLAAIGCGESNLGRERQAIRAPRDGEVMDLNTAVDGFLSIEGPPGLRWTLAPATGGLAATSSR